ncbi:MAG: hypothetical protein E7393_00990 [Ruminococcaceae bacterium]|nr:hypothetical protein [Oscillospiraceae bacterium]
MKYKKHNKKNRMHWLAKCIIKFGVILSFILLCMGFIPQKSSFLAISIGKTAVTMFSISLIAGLLIDVIAQRMGLRE